MSYVVIEDVAASWEHYRRFSEALAGPIPAGLIVHAAGPTEEGFRIVGVWESEEAWRSFLADRLGEGSGADRTVPRVSRPLRPAHVVIGKRVRPNECLDSDVTRAVGSVPTHRGVREANQGSRGRRA